VVDTAKALDKTVETVKTVEKSIDAANLGDGLAQSVKALNNVLMPGQSGAFNTLKPVVGDGLTPHHMPQAARKFTSVVEGGALVIQGIEHKLTRTYGGKGVKTLINEATLSFRSTLARDIWDIKKLTGTKYNFGLNNLLKYYRKYFPGLIKK
jgi:hypothetical protein